MPDTCKFIIGFRGGLNDEWLFNSEAKKSRPTKLYLRESLRTHWLPYWLENLRKAVEIGNRKLKTANYRLNDDSWRKLSLPVLALILFLLLPACYLFCSHEASKRNGEERKRERKEGQIKPWKTKTGNARKATA